MADIDAAPETVPMVRDEAQFPGGPVTADVHASELGAWMAAGWRLAEGVELPEGEIEPVVKDLADMTLEDLRERAAALDFSFTPKATKDQLKAMIEAAGNG